MGKRPWVCTDRWGGWARDHGSVQTGAGGGGGWVRDHGSIQTGGEDGQETTGLYRQVGGGWTRGHGSIQTGGGGGGWARDHGSVQTGGGMDKRPWVCTDRWGGDG